MVISHLTFLQGIQEGITALLRLILFLGATPFLELVLPINRITFSGLPISFTVVREEAVRINVQAMLFNIILNLLKGGRGGVLPGLGLGVMGVWIAMTIDWLFRFTLFLWRLVSGKWLSKYREAPKKELESKA